MPRDLLTDTKIRQTKPKPTPFKLSDGDGLFLQVTPKGARYWRLKYRLGGKEKLFAIGKYPEISLAEARQKTVAARRLIREGVDPVAERRLTRAAQSAPVDTFQSVADEWIASRSGEWSPSYAVGVRSALAANLLPVAALTRVRRDALWAFR